MNTITYRHVYSHRDGASLCDIAEEVELLYGFGVCVVTVGPLSGLYVDRRYPTADVAYTYARELVSAAQLGRAAYQAAVRR